MYDNVAIVLCWGEKHRVEVLGLKRERVSILAWQDSKATGCTQPVLLGNEGHSRVRLLIGLSLVMGRFQVRWNASLELWDSHDSQLGMHDQLFLRVSLLALIMYTQTCFDPIKLEANHNIVFTLPKKLIFEH